MRIAQISPLFESVPPKMYGGTERVVSYLTEALVNQGHDVTLFASGDSKTRARLISPVDEALRLNASVTDTWAHHVLQIQDVIDRLDEFDVVHFHIDYLHFPITRQWYVPHLTTLHGRLDLPDLWRVYSRFKRQPLVSISKAQRKPMPPGTNWVDTVYHGIPSDLYHKGEGNGGYLAFIGRISPEKGPDRAIEIARRAGMKIKIAAKIDKADQLYYDTRIKPLITSPDVEFIGEIGEDCKAEFLGNAKAMLFPIDWPEPFGMVMIEAMACGTPVIAFDRGSVPEIIDPGESGFIVQSVDEAVKALERIDLIDRNAVRAAFEKRFTVTHMTEHYVRLYELLVPKKNIYLPSELKYLTRTRMGVN